MNFYTLHHPVRKKRGALYQIFKVMKITTIILVIACLHVSAAAFAQKVTLKEKDVSLEKVFEDIKKQTGYIFFYEKNVLDGTTKVSINIKDANISDVLDLCLKGQNLTYVIAGNTIGLKKSYLKVSTEPDQRQNASPAPPVTITGKVTDSVGTPLINATVAVKGTTKATITDDKGEFTISANVGDQLIISYVGYNSKEVKVLSTGISLSIQLSSNPGQLKEVVVNNGYQAVSVEKATGAYAHIDNQLLNRSVGSNILDRLSGLATGLQSSPVISTPDGINSQLISPILRSTGLTVRGVASLSVNSSPLIVLDNFPYFGDINNINPNDIESITILKDAAAASIWGAYAGNGVVVLTSKHGNLNHPLTVDFNSTVQFSNKPNLFKTPGVLSSNDYINTEQYLFKQGYYDATLSDNSSYPAYTPVVGILARQRAGLINSTQANSEIDAYRNLDARNDREKYLYQEGINQQYSLGLSGGGNDMSYYASFGWDKNRGTSVNNGFNRKTIDAAITYHPLKKLEVGTSINYTLDNNTVAPTISGNTVPYEMLADKNGNALPITHGYSTAYIDSLKRLGFLDWNYYPLNELKNNNNSLMNHDLNLKVNVKYKLTNYLDLDASYANEYQDIAQNYFQTQQSYAVTNQINTFSLYDPSTGLLTYQFPLGGILNTGNSYQYSDNYRLQANLHKAIGKNGQLTGLFGAEIQTLTTKGNSEVFYGYDPRFATFNNNLDYLDQLTTNPSGTGSIGSPGIGISETDLRYISYFANLAYSYQDRFSVTLTGRKDGSNIFGVHTNDRFNLLWSAGASWNINKEAFYHIDLLPVLKLRATYGFNGNVYNGSGYTTGTYETASYTNLPAIYGLTAPNPNLSWEQVRNVNFGLDFQLKNNMLYGSVDLYRKDGLRLIEPIKTAPSTGFSAYTGNAANTKGKGVELNLNSDIFRGTFKWTSALLATFNKDILTNYSVALTSTSIQNSKSTFVGYPLYSIFSYKWAGLDPTNGNPRGYLNGQVSENYSGIVNNFKADSLIYNGSAVPEMYGSWRNDFSFKKITLSVMLSYELDYYFRKPSSSGNYTDLLGGVGYDYSQAWQKPGDEQHTYVPSYIYPSNSQRTTFYKYSQVLVQNGDNIRLKDIRLSYDLSDLVKRSGLSRLNIFSYASNLGILWRANKYNLDPDSPTSAPIPLTVASGIQATLK